MSSIESGVTLYLEVNGIPRSEQTDTYRLEIAYRMGYLDALSNYAIWKDGVQVVGALERPLEDIKNRFKNESVPLRH